MRWGESVVRAVVKSEETVIRVEDTGVTAESELGRGSTFRLAFPRKQPGSGNGLS